MLDNGRLNAFCCGVSGTVFVVLVAVHANQIGIVLNAVAMIFNLLAWIDFSYGAPEQADAGKDGQ